MPKPAALLDACVLIDLCREDSVLLSLASAHLGPILVLSPVLAEVNQLDEADCERLGIVVGEPDMAIVMGAAGRCGGLSYRDRLCLAYARSESCILYTNDRPLLNAALRLGVDARWGLEILIDLVSAGALTRHAGIASARGILDRSRFPVAELVDEFIRRLR